MFTEIEDEIMWEKYFKKGVAKGGDTNYPRLVFIFNLSRDCTLRLHAGEKMKQNGTHD